MSTPFKLGIKLNSVGGGGGGGGVKLTWILKTNSKPRYF